MNDLIEQYKARIINIAVALKNSEQELARLENDLKIHVANHNGLIGVKEEAERGLELIMQHAQQNIETPPN